MIDSLTSVRFRRAEMQLLINNVPAHVCPGCGEAYVSEEVAMQLLRSAEEIYREGKLEEVIEYRRLYVK